MDDGSQFLFSVFEERTVQFAEAQRQFQQFEVDTGERMADLEEQTVQFAEAQRQFQQFEVDTVERMDDLEERTVQFAEAQRQFQQFEVDTVERMDDLEERTVQFAEAQRQFQQSRVDTVERMAEFGGLVGPMQEEFDKMKDQMKVMREELDQMKDQMKNMEAPRARPATTTTGLAEAALRAASHFTRRRAESVLEEMHRRWSKKDASEFVPSGCYQAIFFNNDI